MSSLLTWMLLASTAIVSVSMLAAAFRIVRGPDDATRAHEEFRMRVDAHKEVALSDIEARREVAEAQAEVLGTALSNADIDIIGGDGQFFDRIAGAISMGKGLDGFVDNSDTARMLGGATVSAEARAAAATLREAARAT